MRAADYITAYILKLLSYQWANSGAHIDLVLDRVIKEGAISAQELAETIAKELLGFHEEVTSYAESPKMTQYRYVLFKIIRTSKRVTKVWTKGLNDIMTGGLTAAQKI